MSIGRRLISRDRGQITGEQKNLVGKNERSPKVKFLLEVRLRTGNETFFNFLAESTTKTICEQRYDTLYLIIIILQGSFEIAQS